MEYQNLDTGLNPVAEYKEIELEIKNLWEKIRKASEVIFILRDENNELKVQYAQVQKKLEEITKSLSDKDLEIARLKTENSKLYSTASEDSMTPAEKEALKKRINELISKINSHL